MKGKAEETESEEIDLTFSSSESEDSSDSIGSTIQAICPFFPPIKIAGNVLSARHYRLLDRGGWFTDDLINAYFHLLSSPRVFSFSSFLLEAGDCHGAAYVSRYWMRRLRQFFGDGAAELVLFPVNSGGSHWVLVAWWCQQGLLQYYDSLMCRRAGTRIMRKLTQLLDACYLFTVPKEDCLEQFMSSLSLTASAAAASITIPAITKLEIPPRQPRQQDGSSCGPFTCAMAEALVRGESLDAINQTSVDAFRRSLIGVFLEAGTVNRSEAE